VTSSSHTAEGNGNGLQHTTERDRNTTPICTDEQNPHANPTCEERDSVERREEEEDSHCQRSCYTDTHRQVTPAGEETTKQRPTVQKSMTATASNATVSDHHCQGCWCVRASQNRTAEAHTSSTQQASSRDLARLEKKRPTALKKREAVGTFICCLEV
jgi:hypothetical protein